MSIEKGKRYYTSIDELLCVLRPLKQFESTGLDQLETSVDTTDSFPEAEVSPSEAVLIHWVHDELSELSRLQSIPFDNSLLSQARRGEILRQIAAGWRVLRQLSGRPEIMTSASHHWDAVPSGKDYLTAVFGGLLLHDISVLHRIFGQVLEIPVINPRSGLEHLESWIEAEDPAYPSHRKLRFAATTVASSLDWLVANPPREQTIALDFSLLLGAVDVIRLNAERGVCRVLPNSWMNLSPLDSSYRIPYREVYKTCQRNFIQDCRRYSRCRGLNDILSGR